MTVNGVDVATRDSAALTEDVEIDDEDEGADFDTGTTETVNLDVDVGVLVDVAAREWWWFATTEDFCHKVGESGSVEGVVGGVGDWELEVS